MSLQPTLADIMARLRQGRFPNEQAISQGIVLRALQELGRDTGQFNGEWTRMNSNTGSLECHARPVEASLSLPVRVRRNFNEGGFIPHPFPVGWLVATNPNNILKKTIITRSTAVNETTCKGVNR